MILNGHRMETRCFSPPTTRKASKASTGLDLDGGEPTFITTGGNPSWSADGATIAFSLEDDQGVSGVYTHPRRRG